MSELIQKNDNRATIRWKLLTGASALALTAYVSSITMANAEDADRPTLWIELGGQMEQVRGQTVPFTAPFTSIDPQFEFYKPSFFTKNQKPPLFDFGGDGSITFQPENSDWTFSAAIRYGRSHADRNAHYQTPGQTGLAGLGPNYYYPTTLHTTVIANPAQFADATTEYSEKHTVVDFAVGKDVGINLFGRDGASNLSAGVRLADLTVSSRTIIYARPNEEIRDTLQKYGLYHHPAAYFTEYTLMGSAQRSFRGIGPSLSWNASTAIAGNKEDGELNLDWGINGAVLFGKQKAKTSHNTTATRYNGGLRPAGRYTGLAYPKRAGADDRSRSVTVPNLGASVGLSVKYPNAKVSIGYRYDTFLKAMDTGIDARKASNLTFSGPFASISIGLGD